MKEKTTMKLRKLVTTLLIFAPLGPSAATQAPSPAGTGELFNADTPLALDIVMERQALCPRLDRSQCPDASATLVYRDTLGTEHQVTARVRLRGRWKQENGNCQFPALFVFFSGVDDDPLFAGQDMLPLTTHCRRQKEYEQNVLKEFLGYRILNLLTEKSLRVRLVRVSYLTPGAHSKPVVRYGFFSEHFRSMARRHGGEVWKTDQFNPLEADPFETALVDLFQFMIGNTDWSSIYGHNIVVIRDQTGTPTAVPFDLDFAGLVNARYAGPPPNLPLKSVRQRLYRGICRADVDWEQLFHYFEGKREAIMALLDEVPGLSSRQRDRSASYLADFYKLMHNPKLRQKKIIAACRGRS